MNRGAREGCIRFADGFGHEILEQRTEIWKSANRSNFGPATLEVAVNSRELLERYQAGQDDAATALFDRYLARLTALARSRLGPKLRRRIDPEDVVQSAYRSFFLHARDGAYELAEAGDLWRLLASIALHKLHRQIEQHTAAKRSVEREHGSGEHAADLSTPEPSAAEVVALSEVLQRALERLSAEQRQVLALLLEGRGVPEISAALGKSDRTARRAVAEVKRALEQQLNGESHAAGPSVKPQPEPHAPLRYSDYLLEQLVGAGGMGKVFRAREKRTGRTVAIKTLHKSRQTDERAIALFVQEAQVLARLRHPGIVGTHGLGRFPGGGYFLALDFIAGRDLQTRLAGGPVPLNEALRIASEVAAAVQYAHEQGVVHCDLKPGNVLLDQQGHVFVTDFGFAYLVADAAATARRLLGGTTGYVASEVLRGSPPTPAADVYALGSLLWALATGDTRADSVGDLERNPVSRSLWAVIERCLAADPERRYRSMNDLAADLQRLREDTVGSEKR